MKKLVFLVVFCFVGFTSANEKGPETENQTAPLFPVQKLNGSQLPRVRNIWFLKVTLHYLLSDGIGFS